jgi:hypothetical protein
MRGRLKVIALIANGRMSLVDACIWTQRSVESAADGVRASSDTQPHFKVVLLAFALRAQEEGSITASRVGGHALAAITWSICLIESLIWERASRLVGQSDVEFMWQE